MGRPRAKAASGRAFQPVVVGSMARSATNGRFRATGPSQRAPSRDPSATPSALSWSPRSGRSRRYVAAAVRAVRPVDLESPPEDASPGVAKRNGQATPPCASRGSAMPIPEDPLNSTPPHRLAVRCRLRGVKPHEAPHVTTPESAGHCALSTLGNYESRQSNSDRIYSRHD